MSGGELQINSLTRRFGGLTAVEDLSVTFAPGEIACVIGPNGAGKSTLLNMVCGVFAPTSGTITFNGRSIEGLARHVIARAGIARKFQVPSFFKSLTVEENLIVAGGQDVDGILVQVNLAAQRDTLAEVLSHGQKQWLEIGMALASKPKLLLLDEPAAGLTDEETGSIATLLLSLKGRITVVVIEHDMNFVRALASRTVVMHQGKLVADGDFEDIERDELVRDVYLGKR